jgi:hypothetical protein
MWSRFYNAVLKGGGSFHRCQKHPEDPRNIYIILDEQSPEHALRLRIGGMTATLAADEALTLLDWLGEVVPDQAKEEQR